jgi:hypothetical protein
MSRPGGPARLGRLAGLDRKPRTPAEEEMDR